MVVMQKLLGGTGIKFVNSKKNCTVIIMCKQIYAVVLDRKICTQYQTNLLF